MTPRAPAPGAGNATRTPGRGAPRGRAPARISAGAPAHVPGLDRADGAIVALIVAGWMLLAWRTSGGVLVYAYDVFRDMAGAQNILHGRLWQDPTLWGKPWWYAPGSPMLVGAIAKLSGLAVSDLYGSSIFWLNWLNPVLLYLLVRCAWGRAAALVALPMVGLGSHWWLTHAFVPIPSVHGVALNLAALLAWQHRPASRWRWPLLAGALVALSLWHHPLCGTIVVMAIAGQALLAMVFPEEASERGRLPRRAAVTLAAALALTAPLLVHMVRLPRLNLDPFHWFAPELHDPLFALHAQTPLVVPLGLVGLWIVLRTSRAHAWLVSYFAAGLLVQLAGYAAHDWGWSGPWLIPHEFQWHEQLALAIGAAVAVPWLAAAAVAGLRDAATRSRTALATAIGLLAITLGPALPGANVAGSQLMHIDGGWGQLLGVSAWVRAHVPFDATIVCHPEVGYFIASQTGRKCVALPSGHMNPSANLPARYADLRLMLTTSSADSFAATARRRGATYLLTIPRQGGSAGLQSIYARWDCLELADRQDSLRLLYRIVPVARR